MSFAEPPRQLAFCPFRTITLLLAALLLTGFAGSALADQPHDDAEEPIFDGLVEVSEVLVDVLATNADGEVVLGLGPDDFIVEEDGKAVPVTSVSFYATRYGVEGDDEVPSSRYFIAFLHDQTRYSTNLIRQQMRVARHLRQWIEEEMLPSDWLAIVSFDTELEVYSDFTQDREALGEAVERAAAGKRPHSVPPSRSAKRNELGILSQRLPSGRELREQTRGNIHDALRITAEALGYLVGRKNMLLYTTGFGKQIGRSPMSRPDPRYYPDLITALNDHNVAVYPINVTPAGREHKQSDFLEQLAEDTGAYYDENFVGFFAPLERVADENYGYYLLSYQTEHPSGEIGYRQIVVRARDEAISVRARRGYRYGL